MDFTEEDNQLILDFINETALLSSHFIDIFNSFSRSIVDLKEKSDRILELLINKQQQVVTALIEASKRNRETVSSSTSGEENLDTSAVDNEGGKEAYSGVIEDTFVENEDLDEDEEARLRLVELMNDSYGEDEEALLERLYREYKLTPCQVVLQRCDETGDLIPDNKQRNRRERRPGSDSEIDNLCNIEAYMANIFNANGKTSTKNSKNISDANRENENAEGSLDDSDTESCSSKGTFNNTSVNEHVSNRDESNDMDDELAKEMLERMMADDEYSQISDSRVEQEEEEKQKKVQEKGPRVTRGNNRQKESLLPPLNLNLFKDQDDDDDDKQSVISLSSDDESIKMVKRSKVKGFESDDSDYNDQSGIDDVDSDFRITRSRNKYLKNLFASSDDGDNNESVDSIRKRRIKMLESLNDSDNNSNENPTNEQIEDSEIMNNSRRKIRKLIPDSELDDETKKAIEAESERLRRIGEQLQKRNLEKTLSQQHIQNPVVQSFDSYESIYLDVEEKLQIDKSISRHLKKHQIEGCQFMWNSCFESVEAIKKEDSGGGCVLAHCMGLGKTLQVIALVHTVFQYSDLTDTRRVLILTPKNTLLNWIHEFNHWLKDCPHKPIQTFEISNIKSDRERLDTIKNWFEHGGVFVTVYQMFVRLLKTKNEKDQQEIENYFLNPGADMIICDEGHTLKNDKTAIAKCVSKVTTKRRIVLTGSPLQNNLMEYHCMVSFVKPNLLGNQKEFRNRFANPIANGQHSDSTDVDVKVMKKRAHCLHKTLVGCVQRMDVVKDLLPPKQEFVISIRLSDVQQRLYELYLKRNNCENKVQLRNTKLFMDFQNLLRIYSHPWLTKTHFDQKAEEGKKQKNEKNDDDDDGASSSFCEEIDIESEDSNDVDGHMKELKKLLESEKRKETANKIKTELMDSFQTCSNQTTNDCPMATNETEEMYSWFKDIITDDMEFNFELSGKMVVFAEILKRCEEIGDKLLVFSQSLLSLDLIERFLKYQTQNKQRTWIPSRDYYRIDGSTEVVNRKKFINQFNNKNSECRLFLISSKAGGIGVNLVGANRVIVFDASWNPVHDIQSMFRVYRLGQDKPVYIYRFLAQGTMEEKIYNRQVIKQSLSLRVIDEHQLQRHFTSTELRELYKFDPEAVGQHKATPKLPADNLLADLLKSCDKWISKYHEHDSLLENRLDEGLDEAERQLAWDEYEQEKRGIDLRQQQQQQQFGADLSDHLASTQRNSSNGGALNQTPNGNASRSYLQRNNFQNFSVNSTATSMFNGMASPNPASSSASSNSNSNIRINSPNSFEQAIDNGRKMKRNYDLIRSHHHQILKMNQEYLQLSDQVDQIRQKYDTQINNAEAERTMSLNRGDSSEVIIAHGTTIQNYISSKKQSLDYFQEKIRKVLAGLKGTFERNIGNYRVTYICYGLNGQVLVDGPLNGDETDRKRLIYNYKIDEMTLNINYIFAASLKFDVKTQNFIPEVNK